MRWLLLLTLWFQVSCLQFNNLHSTVTRKQSHMDRNNFVEFGVLIILKEVIVFQFFVYSSP